MSKAQTYSNYAFIVSLISLGLFLYQFMRIPRVIKASEGLQDPPLLIIVATNIFCFAGVILSVISIVRQEKSTGIKWLGGILNILFFLVLVGTILYAQTIG